MGILDKYNLNNRRIIFYCREISGERERLKNKFNRDRHRIKIENSTLRIKMSENIAFIRLLDSRFAPNYYVTYVNHNDKFSSFVRT